MRNIFQLKVISFNFSLDNLKNRIKNSIILIISHISMILLKIKGQKNPSMTVFYHLFLFFYYFFLQDYFKKYIATYFVKVPNDFRTDLFDNYLSFYKKAFNIV